MSRMNVNSEKPRSDMEHAYFIFRALADLDRMALLQSLMRLPDNEWISNKAFHAQLDRPITQSSAQKHLRILVNAGLVERDRIGLNTYFRASSSRTMRRVMESVLPLFN